MLKLGNYIAAGIIVLGSVLVTSIKAEAVVYEFTDYNPDPVNGDVSASGFFDIDDANDDGLVDFTSELTDYEITLSAAGNGDFTLITGNQISLDDLTGVTVTDTLLDFRAATGGTLCIDSSNDGFCNIPPFNGMVLFSSTINQLANRNPSLLISQVGDNLNFLTATAAPTSVPFEVSPKLGILAVGGIWGISRLRKRTATRKLDNKD